MNENLLHEETQIERKHFSFDLKENSRGRFLRITEDVGGRRDTVIVPSTGLTQFRDMLNLAIEADSKAGPPPESHPDD